METGNISPNLRQNLPTIGLNRTFLANDKHRNMHAIF